jgi:hypothetical protein
LLFPAGRGEFHTISPSWLWCGYRAYRETVPISQKSRDSKKKNCLLNLCNNGTCSQCNTNTHNTSSSLSYGGTLSSSGNRIMVSPDRIWLSIHLQTWGPSPRSCRSDSLSSAWESPGLTGQNLPHM